MYAHNNPFRTSRQEALRFVAPGVDTGVLLARLDRRGGRGALVGPKGSGKTTLLLELADALSARGLSPTVIRLTAEARRPDWGALRGLTARSALLLDGAEQLGAAAWWRVRWLARRASYLVTTSHTRPHLPLLHHHTTSPTLLQALTTQLLAATPATHARLSPSGEDLQALFTRHGGDLRACFRELYDRCGES